MKRPARSTSAHLFINLNGVYQHLGYLFVLSYQPCPIWKIAWGVHSVLEGLFGFLSDIIQRRLWSCWQFFLIGLSTILKRGSLDFIKLVECLSAIFLLYVSSNIFMGYTLLFPDRLINICLSGGVLFGFFDPCFPCSTWSFPRFLEGTS